MALARPMKERTVSFYEIVASLSGEQCRMEQLPWEDTLATIATTKEVDKRTVEAESVFVGNTIIIDEEDHLLLHRVKNAGEWLSVLDWSTGEWRELESRATEGYLDTSVTCFLPYGNVVGMMQGSTSAPSHKSLQTWLNGLKLFPEVHLIARPLMSRAEVERLRTARGASKIEIRIGSSKIAALRDSRGRLASFLQRASFEYGDVDVTVIISVPRGRAHSEDRERLLDDLRDLEQVVPEAAERARATLIYAEQSGPEHSRLVELVEHHITAKRRVAAVDEHGDSIRILSAVGAILGVAAEHEAELRLAVDAT
jgi:hypothetical protein